MIEYNMHPPDPLFLECDCCELLFKEDQLSDVGLCQSCEEERSLKAEDESLVGFDYFEN